MNGNEDVQFGVSGSRLSDWMPGLFRKIDPFARAKQQFERRKRLLGIEELDEADALVPFAQIPVSCPRSEHHAALVVRITGRIRHCVCQSCGGRFKKVGPLNSIREQLQLVAETLRAIPVHEVQGESVVIMTVGQRDGLIDICREGIRTGTEGLSQVGQSEVSD